MPSDVLGDLIAIRHRAEVARAIAETASHPDLAELRNRMHQLATKIIDQSNEQVTVGLFGEYSVGKSLILGTLVGNPLLLPVHDNATTSNVSLLSLHQSEDDGPAKITECWVDYFDQPGLDGYINALFEEARQRAERTNLGGAALNSLALVRGQVNPVTALSAWITASAPQQSTLHALGDEVAALAGALSTMPTLGASTSVTRDQLPLVLSHHTAGDGLTLPDPMGLRARHPLIRRVRLTVDVPVWAWNLAEFSGAQVQLIDLPGRQGGMALVRDEYLGDRELADVTTGLIVLNSDRGEAATPLNLTDLMYSHGRQAAELKDAVLVAAGRFDAMQEIPERLLEDDGRSPFDGAPSEAELLHRSGQIRELIKNTRSLLPEGRDERIAFLSPYIAIARAQENGRVGWNPDEVISKLKIRGSVELAGKKAAIWRRIGFPATALGDALAALADEGGFIRLSKLITKHVNDRGLAVKVLALRRQIQQLEELETRFERRSAELGGPYDASVLLERERLRNAIADLADAVHPDMRERVRIELGDPHYRPGGDRLSLHEWIEQDAAHLVCEWPQWRSLFGSVEKDIVVVRSAENAQDDWPDENDSPVLASDFAAPFRSACADLRARARHQVADMIEDWLGDWQVETATAARAALREALSADVRAKVENAAGRPVATMLAVDRCLTADYLREQARTRLNAAEEAEPPDQDSAFPFDPARALAWHPKSPRRGRRDYCHAITVPRLRRELIAAVTTQVSGDLAQLQLAACAEITKRMREIDQRLTNPHELIELITDNATATSAGQQAGAK